MTSMLFDDSNGASLCFQCGKAKDHENHGDGEDAHFFCNPDTSLSGTGLSGSSTDRQHRGRKRQKKTTYIPYECDDCGETKERGQHRGASSHIFRSERPCEECGKPMLSGRHRGRGAHTFSLPVAPPLEAMILNPNPEPAAVILQSSPALSTAPHLDIEQLVAQAAQTSHVDVSTFIAEVAGAIEYAVATMGVTYIHGISVLPVYIDGELQSAQVDVSLTLELPGGQS